jgi:hypothetical protein
VVLSEAQGQFYIYIIGFGIVRVIKSRRMRWVGHVARMRREEVLTAFWLGGPKARDHWEDLGVDGRITLKWTLGK